MFTGNGRTSQLITAKLNSYGEWAWARKDNTWSYGRANTLALDPANNLYGLGYFSYGVNFGGTNLTSLGSYDIFVGKLATVFPALTIGRSGDLITLSWSRLAQGFTIESRSTYGPHAIWQPVPISPEIEADHYKISISQSNQLELFRLFKP